MPPAGPTEIDGREIGDASAFMARIVEPCRPVVLRGLVRDWPVVAAAKQSPAALQAYLARFATARPAEAFFGDPAIGGRYYYSDDQLSGFNFERRSLPLAQALEAMLANLDRPGAPTVYVGSLPVGEYLPGFAAENGTALTPASVGGRIWLGHASNVSSHYDTFENLACIIAGGRRFTLFPPEAIDRLYPGPIDNTLAGPPVSLAASQAPDPERFPRFEAIRDQALVAELEAGDALFLPKLWWHKVEATGPINGLLNYWWDAFSAGPDAPYAAMLLAMITICERPEPERRAWRAFFDHYVFRGDGHPLAHLPPDRHGLLGPLKSGAYGKLRARVMHMLRGG